MTSLAAWLIPILACCCSYLAEAKIFKLVLAKIPRPNQGGSSPGSHQHVEAMRNEDAEVVEPTSREALEDTSDDLVPMEDGDQFKSIIINNWNMLYEVECEVGTPPTAVKAVLDTGSSDFWIKSSKLVKETSHTFSEVPHSSVRLTYGQGAVRGFEASDRLCLGDLCVPNQALTSVDHMAGIGTPEVMDGLLGLAFPALSRSPGNLTFLQGLEKTHKFHHMAFALALESNTDVGQTSSLSFGELDELIEDAPSFGFDKSSGATLAVVPYNGRLQYWMAETSVTIQGALLFGPPLSNFNAIFDSGTSLVLVPSSSYHTIVSEMLYGREGECERWVCSCDLPMRSLSFRFFDVNRESFTVELRREHLFEFDFIRDGKRYCRFMLGRNAGDTMILGQAFLRRTYVIHDVRDATLVVYPRRDSLERDSAQPDPFKESWEKWSPWHGFLEIFAKVQHVPVLVWLSPLALKLLPNSICLRCTFGRHPATRPLSQALLINVV
mmetsp:Transcript_13915/g.30729  ORF Transcript_13915/g.30729 Transcript_13915/m.30729 type:complete len:495 (+) Transcript_13915:174-1658(+)